MPPSSALFAHRADPSTLPEWMDEPCTLEEFRACLVDLAQVNRLTLAYRPTLEWLEEHLVPGDRPLHVVDVGCGGGDMLRRVSKWARTRGVALQLTGVDLNPYAACVAKELTPEETGIRYVTGNAYSYAPEDGIDIVLSSLFTHHLADAENVRFLAWMEQVARRGWFINDLRRSAVSYALFGVLARTMRWHRMVQHDGPVSIRRSFVESDWQALCREAGVALEGVSLCRKAPWRLCVGRWK